MNRAYSFILTLASLTTLSAQWMYPATKTVDASDTYFGKTYRDPYRWLEDTKDKAVESWFKQQAELADANLQKIDGAKGLAEEWLALDKLKPATYGSVKVENGVVFYKKTLGGENVGKLYYRQGWTSSEKLLFDPTTYKEKENTVVQTFVPALDGKHVALGLTAAGAEYSEIRVLNVEKGTLLPERIYPSWGAQGWTTDNTSFFYDAGKITDIKSSEILLNRSTRVHKLGTPVENDLDIFNRENYPGLKLEPQEIPIAFIDPSLPEYLFGIAATVQAETRLFYAPATGDFNRKREWKALSALSDNLVRGFVPDGGYIYAATHTGAPKYKVVRTKLKSPDWKNAEVVIPEASDSIQYIQKSRNFLFVLYSDGITGRIVQYEFATGRKKEVKLPTTGIVEISCPDWRSDRCIISVTSWVQPTKRFDYDAKSETLENSVFDTVVTYPGFAELVTEEVEVRSHDGAMVPLSIVYKKGLARDGSNSCIMEGYGAYGYSMTPWFDIKNSIATRGVVLAFAHVRGGGEKGEEWYKAGFKTTKSNTWKDFIACAEYLVKQGFTSAEKLAGSGTSAGGILISRAITERPDLFRAAVCNVGCGNAMRLEFSAGGPVNVPEFGTVKDEKECEALYQMDGMQHVKKGVQYPALMGVVGWNDPRVPAWQTGKLVAAVQHTGAPGRPAFLKVNYDNGHFTEEKLVTFRNFADQFAFLLWQTRHKDFQPEK